MTSSPPDDRPPASPAADGPVLVIPEARVHRLLQAFVQVALGERTLDSLRVEAGGSDTFGRLEELLGVFAAELADRTRRNVAILGAVEQARREAAEQHTRRARLQEQLVRAELHSLRSQLQPHFLFNTLNSLSALMEHDVPAAQRMVQGLADFFRRTLQSVRLPEVPLREELELLRQYVAIEQTRFAERLRVAVDVQPDALDVPVPSLVLQPLVENAIRHGIQPCVAGGTVRIAAEVRDGALHLHVDDDGAGLPAGFRLEDATGVGLRNSQTRVRLAHPEGGALWLERLTPAGTRAAVRLPLRAEARP